LPQVNPVEPTKVPPVEQLHNEWLVATLRPNTTFSVPVAQERPTTAGGVERYQGIRSFHVIDVVHGLHRPKLVHTVSSAADPVVACPIAVNVLHYDVWDGSGPAPQGTLSVYAEGDPEWVQPLRLAPIDTLMRHMSKWAIVQPSDTAGVLLLSGETRAVPIFPLTDERCPVLALAQGLNDLGWTSERRLFRHTLQDEKVYDSRNSLRMRWYFRMLHHGLGRVLPLAGGTVPSQEPMAFYRLLIDGIACTPGQKATIYQAILNTRKRKRGEEPVPLPDHEAEPEPPPIMCGGDAMALPLEGEEQLLLDQKRRRRGGGQGPIREGQGHGGGRGQSSAGPSAPPLPPPPIPLPPPPVEVFIDPGNDAALVLPMPDDPPAPPRRAREPANWTHGMDECKVTFNPGYRAPGATRAYANYQITCAGANANCPAKCHKTRGEQFSSRHGDIEPLAYLHAWRYTPWPRDGGRKSHALQDPDEAAVDAMVRDHGVELREIYNRFH